MNVRRGLWRLWVVTAVAFAGGVIALNFQDVKAQFELASLKQSSVLLLPVLCGTARGQIGKDYRMQPFEPKGPWEQFRSPNPFDTCWYEEQAYRAHYPEDKAAQSSELSRRLYANVGLPLKDAPAPWLAVVEVLLLAFGIPLAALVGGTAFFWAFAGFRR